jgi:hypothetical protein
MGINGVKNARVDSSKSTCTVIFDDEKTDPDKIADILGKKKYPVRGAPIFLD